MPNNQLIVLVAPNVTQLFGGEGIKALQIFQSVKSAHPRTIQITHARNREDVMQNLKLMDVYFVEDDWISLFLWKSVVFRAFIDMWFSVKAVALAEKIAKQLGFDSQSTIIHQTGPNSPVLPRAISNKYLNVIGPINGNIYYPEVFRNKETSGQTAKRLMHIPVQTIRSFFFNNVAKADIIFVAGGDRTRDSLIAGGCTEQQFIETVDCGIDDQYLDRPRIEHVGHNYRFVHFGRLVTFKCTDLIIQSLVKSALPIQLDIIGNGPELLRCKQLVQQLGLSDSVHFKPWCTHDALLDRLKNYRGVVLPSIGDSNGIVIQEAMALGLPPICLDWGGPQLLIDHGVNGYLIAPDNVSQITTKMAGFMDTLSEDSALAESISLAARHKSEQWRMSTIATQWTTLYLDLAAAKQAKLLQKNSTQYNPVYDDELLNKSDG